MYEDTAMRLEAFFEVVWNTIKGINSVSSWMHDHYDSLFLNDSEKMVGDGISRWRGTNWVTDVCGFQMMIDFCSIIMNYGVRMWA